jgi:uncharacterized protein involved in tolerance to divalent cations
MVNINQLFIQKPPFAIAVKLLKALGFTNIKDTREITIDSMTKHNTITKITELIPLLQKYYLPCKAKTFLLNLSLKKCITIARQISRLHNYEIPSIEKSVSNKKVMFYRIINTLDKDLLHKTKKAKHTPREYIIVFN